MDINMYTQIHSTIPDDVRYTNLIEKFKLFYNESATCIARAPGRVNLIGEHIDYSGYSVLPMAIDQDILIAASFTSDKELSIENVDPHYKHHNCTLDTISISAPIEWYHYILCGIKGVLEWGEDSEDNLPCRGVRILVDGTIPPASGLSSSSALVCCAALISAYGAKRSLDKIRLADISQRCEKYVGVEGGGMDQAISMMAIEGKAKLIEFHPLKGTDVTLPSSAVFVISNTCVQSCKAATNLYNTRVVECILAAKVIASKCGQQERVKILCDLEKLYPNERMDDIVKQSLHEEPYTREELLLCLDITDQQFNDTYMNIQTMHLNTFHLYSRALHVFQEANRVTEFKATCDSDDPNAKKISDIGGLMNDSHVSCHHLYDCSCDELNEMVDIARESGAIGSRLTGAGWGGCVVSLVNKDDLQSFLKSIHAKYYEKDEYRQSLKEKSVFTSKPGGGACIFTI